MIYQIENNQVVELTSDFVEYLYNFYVSKHSLIVHDGIKLDGVEIPSNVQHIVFNDATNPVNAIDHFLKIKLDRPYTVVTGSYEYHKQSPNPNISFFPFWAVWMSNPITGLLQITNHKFSDSPKKYKISCLNGTLWDHRKLIYLLLSQKNYFKDLVFTYGHRPIYNNFLSNYLFTPAEIEQYQSLPSSVEFLNSDTSHDIDLTVNHPAYKETYVNLVTETTITNKMLSEKTFKPIIAGQLFVLIASVGAVQFLRDIGLDTFDDIIDHRYDTIHDDRERIEQALVQVDYLNQLDLATVYEKIKSRLKGNSEYFLSQKFRDQFNLNFG